jgi:ribosomal protein L12E/L44/L45/RPP1/RPP2
MSDMDDQFDDDQDDTGQDGPSTNADFAWRRKQEKAVKQAQAEANSAKREAAFLRAGIDPDDTRLSYFVKGYEGDLTAAAIKSAAVEAGFLAPPPPDPQQQQQQQATATAARVAGYSAGAEATPSENEQATAAMRAALAEGGPDALAAYLRSQGVQQVGY